jgi:hypothetical protein
LPGKKLSVLALLLATASTSFGYGRLVVLEEAYSEVCDGCVAASSTLDQICQDYAGQVAPIEWHVNSTGYPLYSTEAKAKMFLYPPPFYGGYVTPWLWVDGKSLGSSYDTWASYVAGQVSVPTDVSLAHVGTTYDPTLRNGSLKVECHNGGATSIDAALLVALTEDSIYFDAPNGDPWHNHVCRDYIPDENGTPVTLAPGATDTVILPYAVHPAYVAQNVKLVVYLQNMAVQPDSSLPCYQGLVGNVLDFVNGVEESKSPAVRDLRVSATPNPCRIGCQFVLSGAVAEGARITMYAADGRLVSSFPAAGSRTSWTRAGLARGVYLYRVNAGTATAEGKLIVTD